MRGRAWSRTDRATLRLLWPTTSVDLLVTLLSRSASSVRNEAWHMGLGRSRRPWTTGEEVLLRREYPRIGAVRLALMLGRTDMSVIRRAYELGVRRRAVSPMAMGEVRG